MTAIETSEATIDHKKDCSKPGCEVIFIDAINREIVRCLGCKRSVIHYDSNIRKEFKD